jgi:hypothetical protein
MLPWPCSACDEIASLLQHLPAVARWSYSGACVDRTAACRRRPAAMAEPTSTRETLITLPCTRAEARVIKLNARARGQTVAGWLRQLLKRENVDLLR